MKCQAVQRRRRPVTIRIGGWVDELSLPCQYSYKMSTGIILLLLSQLLCLPWCVELCEFSFVSFLKFQFYYITLGMSVGSNP